jgi:hypothetical protein
MESKENIIEEAQPTPSLDPRAIELELTPEKKRQILAWANHDLAKAQAKALEIYKLREEIIRKSDPESADADLIGYSYRPETFKLLDAALAKYDTVLVSGANREGKSYACLLNLTEYLVNNKGVMVGFFENTAQDSIIKQQVMVHAMLPREYRTKSKKGRVVERAFGDKNGFSDSRFILPRPNKSMGIFLHYSQGTLGREGYEFDKIYFAENVPLELIQTMKYRVRGHAKKLQIIYDFTPKWGFTPALKEIMEGMVVTKWAKADLLPPGIVHVPGCPPGCMPTEMVNESKGTIAIFFHNGTNPLGGGAAIRQKLIGATTDEIMIRAYGYARRYIGGAFSRFDEKVHCISRAAFNAIAAKGGRRICVCDGAGGRNWFFKWYFITPDNHAIIYREWPDYQQHGEWAMVGDKTDWKEGPAQRDNSGKGFRDYKVLVLELEGGRWDTRKKEWDMSNAETIDRRIIDPRFGAGPVTGQDETTTIIANLAHNHTLSEPYAPPQYWDAAQCGQYVDDTIEMINNRFAYNLGEPLSPLNCPTLYLVDDLEQTKTAFREWANNHSAKCALKDIIDCDRYFVKEDEMYFAPGQNQPVVICSEYE